MLTLSIESTSALRARLGKNLDVLREKFDVHAVERRKTAQFRNQFLYLNCPTCGVLFDGKKVGEMAHIRALEHGYFSEHSNLILLCRECHKDYDAGYVSCAEVEQVAKSGSNHLIRELVEKRKEEIARMGPTFRNWADIFPGNELNKFPVAQSNHQFRIASFLLKKLMLSTGSTPLQQNYAKLLYLQFERRRGAKGTLQNALTALAELDPKKLPKKLLPLYFYEAAFLKMYLGLHEEADDLFAKSRESALKIDDRIARFESTFAETIRLGNSVVSRKVAVKRNLSIDDFRKAFKILLSESQKMSPPYNSKAEFGILTWEVPFLIKYGFLSEAREKSVEMRRSWEKLHLANGWNRILANTISYQIGLIDVLSDSESHVRSGLVRLVRELSTSLTGRPRRPEGLRDVLFGISLGLKKLDKDRGNSKLAASVSAISEEILDGCSFHSTMEDSISKTRH